MKFASVALVASMAINGVANAESNCVPCNNICHVRGDPHVTSFAGKTYKLDPKGKWNNLYTSGSSKVTAKISGTKEGEYITQLRVGGKVFNTKTLCEGDGKKHAEIQIKGAKVTIDCAKPKEGQCGKVDCNLWHFDVKVKKTDLSEDAQKSETGACTFGCDCGDKPSPSPSPSPSGDDCKDLVESLCGKAPKGCNIFGGNDGKSKCDSYDKCLNNNSKKLNNNKVQCLPKPGPSPSPSPGPKPSGGTCTCTARCNAFGDPHVKSFANEQYKTNTGGSKTINLYSVGKFSAKAHISDHKSKEYMTEFYHNGKEIINTETCKDRQSANFDDELKDGSRMVGTVTCRTNAEGFRYLNVRLAKQFSVKADSGIMSAGAGNQSFEAMKSTIGGSGECMFADKQAPKASNIVCKC